MYPLVRIAEPHWAGSCSNLQFRQGPIEIEVSPVKVLCPRKVRFTRVRMEAKRTLNRRFRQPQTIASMIQPKEVKEVVSVSRVDNRPGKTFGHA